MAADSSARDREPELLTVRPVAFAGVEVEAGRPQPADGEVLEEVAGGEDPEVDTTELQPQRGDRYLLCSDGLFAVMSDQQIAAILGDRSLSLQEICQRLVDAANAGGGPDNITALVLQCDVP